MIIKIWWYHYQLLLDTSLKYNTALQIQETDRNHSEINLQNNDPKRE